MLTLIVLGEEVYNEQEETFHTVDDKTVSIEHSLISLSKWESKYQIPFLAKNDKTGEQIFDYIKMMIVGDTDPEVVYDLSESNLKEIQDYIDSSQSATTFGDMPASRGRQETITSELIYYWMVMFNIPFECQHWHLNRLFSLIKICNIKQSPPKKMSMREMAKRRNEINAKRRAEIGTTG